MAAEPPSRSLPFARINLDFEIEKLNDYDMHASRSLAVLALLLHTASPSLAAQISRPCERAEQRIQQFASSADPLARPLFSLYLAQITSEPGLAFDRWLKLVDDAQQLRGTTLAHRRHELLLAGLGHAASAAYDDCCRTRGVASLLARARAAASEDGVPPDLAYAGTVEMLLRLGQADEAVNVVHRLSVEGAAPYRSLLAIAQSAAASLSQRTWALERGLAATETEASPEAFAFLHASKPLLSGDQWAGRMLQMQSRMAADPVKGPSSPISQAILDAPEPVGPKAVVDSRRTSTPPEPGAARAILEDESRRADLASKDPALATEFIGSLPRPDQKYFYGLAMAQRLRTAYPLHSAHLLNVAAEAAHAASSEGSRIAEADVAFLTLAPPDPAEAESISAARRIAASRVAARLAAGAHSSSADLAAYFLTFNLLAIAGKQPGSSLQPSTLPSAGMAAFEAGRLAAACGNTR